MNLPVESLHCVHQPACPGCPRLPLQEIPQDISEGLDGLLEKHQGRRVADVFGRATSFRNRARLAVRGSSHRAHVGIFEGGTHHVVDTTQCLIHHQLINRLTKMMPVGMRRCRVFPYREGILGDASLRYLCFQIERSSDRLQLALVVNCDSMSDPGVDKIQNLIDYLLENEPRLTSVGINFNSSSGNAIVGEKTHWVFGNATLVERIGGATVYFPFGSFAQSNIDVYEQAVRQIHSYVQADDTVVEYYAGVGSIGLGLAPKVKEIRFNELSGPSLDGLTLGVEECRKRTTKNAVLTIHAGQAGEHTALLEGADTVIVDPPRKGLDAALLQGLLENPPKRIVYLSCGFKSLQRDIAELCDSGKYRLVEAGCYDFFPYTSHAEVLAYFERIEG